MTEKITWGRRDFEYFETHSAKAASEAIDALERVPAGLTGLRDEYFTAVRGFNDVSRKIRAAYFELRNEQ